MVRPAYLYVDTRIQRHAYTCLLLQTRPCNRHPEPSHHHNRRAMPAAQPPPTIAAAGKGALQDWSCGTARRTTWAARSMMPMMPGALWFWYLIRECVPNPSSLHRPTDDDE